MTDPTALAEPTTLTAPPEFLLALSDALRPLDDPAAVQATAARVLGETLGVDRAYYVAVDDVQAEYVVEREWHRSGAPSHARRYPLAAWPMPWLTDGRPWVIVDVDTDPALPDDQRAAYRGNDIGACVVVPLVRDGQLVATLVANQRAPRDWTSGEIAMVEATAARTWAAVEQARAALERERRHDEALRVSEVRFRTVQDASPHGLVLLRPVRDAERVVDFRIHYANPAGARLTGQRLDGMVGHTLLELFPSARQLGLFDAYVRVIENGEVWEDDVRYVADGLAAGYQLAAVRVGDGTDAELVLLYADATARLAAEAERARLLADLAAERERLRALILQMPTPVALLEGPEHRFALVNDAYKRISGGGRDVTGLTPPQAFPELAGSGIYELFDQVYETGAPWDGPESLVRYDRDGTGVIDTWFNLRFEPVRNGEGQVVAILNFAVDVTDQVRARHQVESLLAAERTARGEAEMARTDAESANRAKGEFLAVMSHELRTPLNAIGGYTELIELGIYGPLSEAQRAALARIQASQRHLLGLIAGVLDYSRVEAGAVAYRIADVPVADAVAEAETLVSPQLRAKGLGYAWSGAAPELRVRADREKLQQILLNLLGNAVKFTNPRDGAPGRIEVTCMVEAGADGDAAASDRVRIRVRDTGDGIAAEECERVFEPFVQVDQRLTRPHSGVGLGLAISRDLARGMDGELTVESMPGVGSTFTLTLPRA